jgi:Zn-dependent peptidase ImmA (M78 family)/transcriptional regulator with XRE-family HTH domain
MPAVNPDILTWARETAGLSIEEAAGLIQLNAAHGQSGADRLKAIEAGDGEPSRSLLKRMAERYHRPLITFFLPVRPAPGDRGEDFRRAPDAPPVDYDPRLDALLRDVRARHDIVHTLLLEEETPPLSFIGSLKRSRTPADIARAIADTIKFDLRAFRRARSARQAFAYLRERLESAGIFVLLLGNLGSYHTNISSMMFRGYAIADAIAPFIVINENDNDTSWAFTALHEAAHLWLGQTGISGAAHTNRIEQLCNDVAGRLLFPVEDITPLRTLVGRPFDVVLGEVSRTARDCNVSRRMVAYQLLRHDIIDGGMYQRLTERFRADWERSRVRDPDSIRDDGGVSFYVVRRHRLGPALMSLAQRAVAGGELAPTRAARLLGVKATSVHPLLTA